MTAIALVTGASKGIGRAIAATLAENGMSVVNISRTPCDLEGVRNVALDLASPGFESEIRELAAELGNAQIHLVHNAARLTSESVRSINADDYRQTLEINILAPQLINQAFIPNMQPGSSIIYIGSTLSEKGVPNSYSYVVTKHASVGMMRATCQDLAGTGIHTACICPGFTDTEMLRAHVGDSQDILDSIAAASTYGRLIRPEEIASVVAYAVTNPVINGAVIHANLGQIET